MDEMELRKVTAMIDKKESSFQTPDSLTARRTYLAGHLATAESTKDGASAEVLRMRLEKNEALLTALGVTPHEINGSVSYHQALQGDGEAVAALRQELADAKAKIAELGGEAPSEEPPVPGPHEAAEPEPEWRKLPLGDMLEEPNVVGLLADAEIKTVGDLYDKIQHSDNPVLALTELKGIGRATARKILATPALAELLD